MILGVNDHSIEYISGISAVVDRYDGFLLDIWGVLHDGSRLYPGVRDCLSRLKRHQKTVVLLSNSARLTPEIEEQIKRLGLSENFYDHILSSGEVTREAFLTGSDRQIMALGKRYYLWGPGNYGLIDGLELAKEDDLRHADFVFVTGVVGNPATTAEAEPMLAQAVSKNLTMVCANPDMNVVRGGKMGIGPGAVAARYEALGGSVLYFGKPHRAIYRKCMDLLDIDASRIVAVGDSLKTDIGGASTNGIDSILVSSGIHADELADLHVETENLSALLTASGVYPTMIAAGMMW